ncbi:MAG TPA: hypothetical protein VLI90_08830, partial [Tepidisphaeraceae bacterium]|nr:hypothetical protein [Tepidisphaeraceae bacterium]
ATIRGLIHGGQLITTAAGGALGYAIFGGTQVEVRFTLAGDATLDRSVGVGDLGALATNYGTTAGAIWGQGDFDYNGTVDVADLGKLATNYSKSLSGGLGQSAIPAAAAGAPASAVLLSYADDIAVDTSAAPASLDIAAARNRLFNDSTAIDELV